MSWNFTNNDFRKIPSGFSLFGFAEVINLNVQSKQEKIANFAKKQTPVVGTPYVVSTMQKNLYTGAITKVQEQLPQ
jgi:hypothetical protein